MNTVWDKNTKIQTTVEKIIFIAGISYADATNKCEES